MPSSSGAGRGSGHQTATSKRQREKELWAEQEAAKLPRVPGYIIDTIMSMLMQDQGMTKPPEKAAALLGLIVALHSKEQVLPHRLVLAKAINGTKDTVDNILSTRQAQGYIKEQLVIGDGNISSRPSVIHHRRFVPMERLLQAVVEAKERRRRK